MTQLSDVTIEDRSTSGFASKTCNVVQLDRRAEKRGVETSLKAGKPFVPEILPMPLFLDQLRREIRRAERSNTTLSLLIVSADHELKDHAQNSKSLLGSIRLLPRDTDYLGFLGDETLGLLLPETDAAGAQVTAERIAEQLPNHRFSLVTKTYPDELFARLEAEAEIVAEHPLAQMGDEYKTSKPSKSLLKRTLDIVGALTGMVVLSPLMLGTAIAVKLTSPGPIIFKQTRLGRNGKPFVFYKFRSMVNGADDRVHREYLENLISGNIEKVNQGTTDDGFFKMKSDNRVTRVGRFIRKTSIDELPQLFNVLRGDMSLVGPRPPLPYEAKNYSAWHLRRVLEAKPGLTGLWQVEGRSTTSFDDSVRLDLRYLREWSIFSDVKLIFATVMVVLTSRGGV